MADYQGRRTGSGLVAAKGYALPASVQLGADAIPRFIAEEVNHASTRDIGMSTLYHPASEEIAAEATAVVLLTTGFVSPGHRISLKLSGQPVEFNSTCSEPAL